jgi:hypothetical protein
MEPIFKAAGKTADSTDIRKRRNRGQAMASLNINK